MQTQSSNWGITPIGKSLLQKKEKELSKLNDEGLNEHEIGLKHRKLEQIRKLLKMPTFDMGNQTKKVGIGSWVKMSINEQTPIEIFLEGVQVPTGKLPSRNHFLTLITLPLGKAIFGKEAGDSGTFVPAEGASTLHFKIFEVNSYSDAVKEFFPQEENKVVMHSSEEFVTAPFAA